MDANTDVKKLAIKASVLTVFTIIYFYLVFKLFRKHISENYPDKPPVIFKTFGTILRNNESVKNQSSKLRFKAVEKNKRQLPETFNALHQWRDFLGSVQDQGSCGSCWAQSSVLVLQDRINLITNGKWNTDLSIAKMISCGFTFDKSIKKYGGAEKLWDLIQKDPETRQTVFEEIQQEAQCNGQSLYDSARVLYLFGTPTFSCIPNKGQTISGKDYNIITAISSRDIPICWELTGRDIDTCRDTKEPLVAYRIKDAYNIPPIEEEIKYEIFHWGPVLAGFQIFPDFLYEYDGKGIYRHSNKKQEALGGHAIGIIGWGIEDVNGEKVKYWLCRNSWSSSWGIGGFFKIEMFIKECQLEENLLGITPDIPGWGLANQPVPDVISKSDIDIRTCKALPSHCINPESGLVNSSLDKIKSGELVGSINKPIIDPSIILPYDKFWAGDLVSTGKNRLSDSAGTNKGISPIKIIPFVIIYIILMYVLWRYI